MTRDDIIRMAREAGLAQWSEFAGADAFTFAMPEKLERFAALVAAHEREMCAQMCDVLAWNAEYGSEEIKIAALAIRERGEK